MLSEGELGGVGDLLRAVPVPGEPEEAARAWGAVPAAYPQRPPRTSRFRAWTLALLAPMAVGLAGVLALSPAGANVGRWIARTLGLPRPAPVLGALPASGRLLVSGPEGTWSVFSDGSLLRLGPWRYASWSPHGRFIAAARGDQLAA